MFPKPLKPIRNFLNLVSLCLPAYITQAEMIRNIVYKEVNGQEIALDVCTQDAPGTHPVAILVHGGGWGSGDKKGADKPDSGADISPWFDAFSDAGFVWFSINYRLAPQNRWPACLEDTTDAIQWIHQHAAEFGGDSDRMIVVGHSAGGQLAVLSVLKLDNPRLIQGVIGCAAVTSFEQDLEARGGLGKALQDLFDQPQKPNPESLKLLHEHSPINCIPNKPLPEFLFIHGDADKTVPLQQSLDFRNRLLEQGTPCELKIIPEAQHRLTEWKQYDPDWGKKMTDWAMRSVNRAKLKQQLASIETDLTKTDDIVIPNSLSVKPNDLDSDVIQLHCKNGFNLGLEYKNQQLERIRLVSKKPLQVKISFQSHSTEIDIPTGTEIIWDHQLKQLSEKRLFNACVALDGSGEYETISSAVGKAPLRSSKSERWIIWIEPGIYHEFVYLQREKRFLTLMGESPGSTVLTYHLNANMPGPDGKPIGTFKTASVVVDADDFLAKNLTFQNSAGPTGQALAIRIDGDRAVFSNCRFTGWQDTVLTNRGRQYFKNCTIEGQTDFIFGGATSLFDQCEIHCLKSSYITAASTPNDEPYGYVFSECTITGENPLVKMYLGRPWRDFAAVAFLNCHMDDIIKPEGWHNWGQPNREQTSRYLEGGNTGPGADTSARVSWCHIWSESEVRSFNPKQILAGCDKWVPELF